jgi:hypothetical protein
MMMMTIITTTMIMTTTGQTDPTVPSGRIDPTDQTVR